MTDARRLVASAAAVLLDFDGPVTPLMPAPTNAEAADAARGQLVLAGLVLPADINSTTDHLAVLRYAGTLHDDDMLARVERACVDAEASAATSSRPTTGGTEFIRMVHDSGRPLVIVTNNTAEAVDTYLARFDLGPLVSGVVAREPHRPALMKPDPRPILRGLAYANTPPDRAVLVGDSVSDVEAANKVGVPCVGLAKSAARADELAGAGVAAVVRSMTELAEAAR